MSIPTDQIDTFRAQWATRLEDAADVKRLPSSTDRGSINETTLQYPDENLTTVYTARPCLIRPMAPNPGPSDFGQQSVTFSDYAIYFAHDTTGLRVEDRIIPTAVAYDAELVGEVLRISSLSFDSYKTRLMVTATLDLGAGEQG